MTPPPARRGTGGRPGPSRRPGSSRRTGPANAGTTRKSQPTRPPVERPSESVDVHDPFGIRLQKLLAASGVGSRRKCEELIAEGRVEAELAARRL